MVRGKVLEEDGRVEDEIAAATEGHERVEDGDRDVVRRSRGQRSKDGASEE